MADAQAIIDAATLNLGRRPAGTGFDSHDSAMNTELFTALQDLIANLAESNKLQIPTPSATTDTLDLYPGQVEALKWLFTKRCISALRVSAVNPWVMQMIDAADDDIQKYRNIDISVDLSEFSRKGRWDINTDR